MDGAAVPTIVPTCLLHRPELADDAETVDRSGAVGSPHSVDGICPKLPRWSANISRVPARATTRMAAPAQTHLSNVCQFSSDQPEAETRQNWITRVRHAEINQQASIGSARAARIVSIFVGITEPSVTDALSKETAAPTI